ncbi:MAG: SDR family oxidoreductase [Actinobacteria bacterium]|nr:SDR family oxidoreductase [Actinomycetota bacterium]
MSGTTQQITVLGATGKVGSLVARRALARGVRVVALVRDPARLPADLVAAPGLTVVRGTLDDGSAMRAALDGSTAVVSAVGVRYRAGNPFKGLDGPADVVPTAVSAVLAAAAGAPRLVLLSAFGAGDSRPALPAVFRLVVRLSALRHSYENLDRAERLALAGHLPVTVVRAVTLTDAPGTGRSADATGRALRGNPKVAREDVADLLLATALSDGAGTRVLVAAS